MTGAATASGLVLAAEALYAVLKPAPDQPSFDASGVEGDAALPHLHLAVVGDSTTTGPGVAGPEEIWVRQLARRLSDRAFVRVTSLAEGGSTAGRVRRRQLEAAAGLAADVVFVSVGANDALRWIPCPVVERHLDVIVARLTASARMVVLAGIGDLGTIPRLLPPLDRVVTRRGRAVDALHDRVARRHGAVKVDMWSLTTHEFRTNRSVFSEDLFHPGAVGHRVWADAAFVTIAPHLDSLLNGRMDGRVDRRVDGRG